MALVALVACGESPSAEAPIGSTGEAATDGTETIGSSTSAQGSSEESSATDDGTTGEADDSGSTGELSEGIHAAFLVGEVQPSGALGQFYYRVEESIAYPPVPIYEDDLNGSWERATLLSERRAMFRVQTPSSGAQLRVVDLSGPLPAASTRLDEGGVDPRFFVVDADASVLYSSGDSMYRVNTDGSDPAPVLLAPLPRVQMTDLGPLDFDFDPKIDPMGRYAISAILDGSDTVLARVALDGSAVSQLPEGWSMPIAFTDDGNGGFFRNTTAQGDVFIHADLEDGVGEATTVYSPELYPAPRVAVARPSSELQGMAFRIRSEETERIVYVGFEEGSFLSPVELGVGDEDGALGVLKWSDDGNNLLFSVPNDSGSEYWVAVFGDEHTPELFPLSVDGSNVEFSRWGPESSAVYVTHLSEADNFLRAERTFLGPDLGQVFQPMFVPFFFNGGIREFSPDGSLSLVRAQIQSGQGPALFVMDVSGEEPGDPTRVSIHASAFQAIYDAQFSSDSSVLGYSVFNRARNRDEENFSNLYVVDPDDPTERIEVASEIFSHDNIMLLPHE